MVSASSAPPSIAEVMASGRIRQRSVPANGLDFPILEAGEGPLVLCMHGFPDHARSWAQVLDRLAAEGFWAVAPALRGYWPGGAAPDGRYRGWCNGQDVLALITALGRDQADLIGHDFGARAVYTAASLDPARVRRLVAMSVPTGPKLASAFVADGDQQRRSWYMFFFQTALADMAVPLGDFAFIDRLWREWSPGFVNPPEEAAALRATLGAPGVLSEALAYYRQLFTPPPDDAAIQALEAKAAGPISAPSLYLHGVKDGCIGVDLSEGMDVMFPGGLEKINVPDAGHFLHLEQPEAVLDHIVDFLKG